MAHTHTLDGLMIKLVEAEKFFYELDRNMAELEVHVIEQFSTFCYGAFNYLLHQTPQWTGNAAANWNVNIGSPDTSQHVDLLAEAKRGSEKIRSYDVLPGGPFQKGHDQAMSMAKARNNGTFRHITLKNDVYLSNSSRTLYGASYIEYLESNLGNFLRPENNPGHMVANTILTFGDMLVGYGDDLEQLTLPFGGFKR